jgi:tripartite-type tricarboxylate transporter receptor subunit TctC
MMAPALAGAENAWPSGVIRIIVPAPPGGSVDIIARLAQPGLQNRLGVTIIVENKSGGGTSLGAADVARSDPDGTKWLINADPQVLNPTLLSNLPYDTEKDFDPILLVGTSPNLIAANPNESYRNLADILEDARKPSGVNIAALAETLALVSTLRLNKLAGTHLTPITYRGANQAITDVIGNQIGLIAGSASLLFPYFAKGQLKAIAQTGEQRHPALPAVPTISESGFPGFSASSFWGFYARSGTPKPIKDRVALELATVFGDPEITKRMQEALLLDIRLEREPAFRAFVHNQIEIWGEVIRENGLQRSI